MLEKEFIQNCGYMVGWRIQFVSSDNFNLHVAY
jgi:hypothetical protein